MADEKRFSQQDIDALLGSVRRPDKVQHSNAGSDPSPSRPSVSSGNTSSGNRQGAQGHGRQRDVNEQPFDPASQNRVVRERLHTLEIINERFARQFRMNLFNLLRRSADISVDSMKYLRFSDFSEAMPSPINLNVITMKPLRGNGLFVFPQELVYMIVENLFGGDGRFVTRNEVREFTGTEQRIIQRVLRQAMDAYEEAWKVVYPLHIGFVRSEMQPKFASITSSPSEIVIATEFHLEVGNLKSSFQICMPYSMIEPLRDKLTNLRTDSSSASDKIWRNRISHELQSSNIELVAEFTKVNSRVSEVMSLKVGDVLPIELPKKVTARVSGMPVMECEYGSNNGQRALRVIKMLENNSIPTSAIQLQDVPPESEIEEYDDD